jgi:hypothetical protein
MHPGVEFEIGGGRVPGVHDDSGGGIAPRIGVLFREKRWRLAGEEPGLWVLG